jgi:methylthioribose-1-phosphate isomerase
MVKPSRATIIWTRGCVKIIDQTRLPRKCEYLYCRDVSALWEAIRRLRVRGAPALGVAAAFGVLLGIKTFSGRDCDAFASHVREICDYIGTSRPTAVNLFNALDAMKRVMAENPQAAVSVLKRLLREKAMEIYEEDRQVCRAMGRHGAALIPDGGGILTVCNAGALATVDYGTALGVMYRAKEEGKSFKVYACETRPLLQGARLTAWELLRDNIDTTLICDNMAATLMRQGKIAAVFVGADRIAANGDTANKIGTYSLAVLARYHRIPFYVAAPLSTFDRATTHGKDIPIEERGKEEVIAFAGRPTAPARVKVYNPAFDVTDHQLITAIVTEKGILRPPFKANIQKVFAV